MGSLVSSCFRSDKIRITQLNSALTTFLRQMCLSVHVRLYICFTNLFHHSGVQWMNRQEIKLKKTDNCQMSLLIGQNVQLSTTILNWPIEKLKLIEYVQRLRTLRCISLSLKPTATLTTLLHWCCFLCVRTSSFSYTYITFDLLSTLHQV